MADRSSLVTLDPACWKMFCFHSGFRHIKSLYSWKWEPFSLPDSTQAALCHCYGSINTFWFFSSLLLISRKLSVSFSYMVQPPQGSRLCFTVLLLYWSPVIDDNLCVCLYLHVCVYPFSELKSPGAMELRVGNKYRLGRKIGSGSFGDIYLGENLDFVFC